MPNSEVLAFEFDGVGSAIQKELGRLRAELAALKGAGGEGETWLEKEAAALDESRGLYRKYYVKRLRDESGKHRDCTYFVLDEMHDKFTGAALRAYADACETEFPQLAADLRSRHPSPPPQQPGVSGEREPVKLDSRMAEVIRSRYRAGESVRELATDYNTTVGAVLRAFDEENDDV